MKKINQSGLVSMISVVIFSIIITVIAMAYIQSVISQQKNALNFDFGTRAYYSAESGAQDAIRGLEASPALQTNGQNSCKTSGGTFVGGNGTLGEASSGLGYTCQLIKVQATEVNGSVSPSTTPNSKTAMFKLEPAQSTPPATGTTPGYRLGVSWSRKTTAPEQALYPRATEEPIFTQYNRWFSGADTSKPIHALLRVAVISVPKIGASPLVSSFSRSAIKQRVVYMNPVTQPNSIGEFGNFVTFKIDTDSVLEQQSELFNNAECHSSDPADNDPTPAGYGTFACKRTIELKQGYDLTRQDVYVRINSVYKATDFSVQLTRVDNSAIPLTNAQAIVDVTGKAGSNVYRRIQQTFPFGGGYYTDPNPDAALIAGEGICKLFSVGTAATTYTENPKCNPLDSN